MLTLLGTNWPLWNATNGWSGTGYVMNDMVTTGQVRNRPVITFTNNTAATRTIDVAVFIGG